MIIMGIDPSINNVGVAVVKCEKGRKTILKLKTYKTIKGDISEKIGEIYDCISFITGGIVMEEKKGYWLHVVIEEPLTYTRKTYGGKSQNVSSVIKLNMAFTAIYLAAREHLIAPDGLILKPAPSGYGKNKKGLPTKEKARYILQAHFPEDIEKIKSADLNAIDALMLAVWGCEQFPKKK